MAEIPGPPRGSFTATPPVTVIKDHGDCRGGESQGVTGSNPKQGRTREERSIPREQLGGGEAYA